MTRRPSDDAILEVLRERTGSGTATYVVRNWLGGDTGTPAVLRALKRLEKAGKVKRVRTNYAVMISWRLA